jgi:hypothetical protein
MVVFFLLMELTSFSYMTHPPLNLPLERGDESSLSFKERVGVRMGMFYVS